MAVTEQTNSFVVAGASQIAFSQMFTVTASASNPAFVVLAALDRNEYTAAASGATGSFSGNGHSTGFANIEGDGRGTGIVFAYQDSTGRYYSSFYGYLDQLTYIASGSLNDVTNLSLFGFNDLSQATTNAGDAYSLMQANAAGYLGSATVVTQPTFAGPVPVQATPGSIMAVAKSFVGQAWNMDGCWVLTSVIAAEAGASLPAQSTLIGLPGQSNGEWFVAFNGPAGQAGNWQSMVKAGEMVVIGTPGGGGHITTCVSGSGGSAMLVDNAAFANRNGQVQNAANDGSSSDIIISAPHSATPEWSGVQASSVVIYELDTPVVTAAVLTYSLRFLGSQALAPLFTAIDPAGTGITAWQVYDTATSDSLAINGSTFQDHSATSALTAASLAGIFVVAGSTSTIDTVGVRAFNGTYWGDWASLAVSIVAVAPAPPLLVVQTAGQTWKGGTVVVLTLPGASFSDPGGQALSYAATLANGGALPNWLSFNAGSRTFTGFIPMTPQALTILITATDTGGLSASETFSATVVGPPVVVAATPNQFWTGGGTVSLTLPANSFTDPQSQTLTYSARLSNGQALPSWLSFDAPSRTFSGLAPTAAQSLGITVTATDRSGLSACESFAANIQGMTSVPVAVISVTSQTPNQIWTAGQAVHMALAPNTFTDALGLRMTFSAYEVSGPDVTSWLYFDRFGKDFFGLVPGGISGTAQIRVTATDSRGFTATDLFSVTLAPQVGHASNIRSSNFAGSMGLAWQAPVGTVVPIHG